MRLLVSTYLIPYKLKVCTINTKLCVIVMLQLILGLSYWHFLFNFIETMITRGSCLECQDLSEELCWCGQTEWERTGHTLILTLHGVYIEVSIFDLVKRPRGMNTISFRLSYPQLQAVIWSHLLEHSTILSGFFLYSNYMINISQFGNDICIDIVKWNQSTNNQSIQYSLCSPAKKI